MSLNQTIWTYQLNAGSITIDGNYSLSTLSICLNSGTGTIKGSCLAGSTPSAPIDLVLGQAITMSGEGEIPLDGITITTTGVVALIGRQ